MYIVFDNSIVYDIYMLRSYQLFFRIVNSMQCLEDEEEAPLLIARAIVTRGPYTAINDTTCSAPVLFRNPRPGHTPTIVPTAKLASTMEDPSKGSNATENPEPEPVAPQSSST
jgi:hypothetical protein